MMTTSGHSFLSESLNELRAALAEVRGLIEEARGVGSPSVFMFRERLNALLEAEQVVLTKIDVLNRRTTPYNCDIEIDTEAEECAEWLVLARQVRARTKEERLSLVADTRGTALPEAQQLESPNIPEGGVFSASEDYRSVRFKGVMYTTTRNQATMIRELHKAYMAGHPDIGAMKLLEATESETSYVRDTFKNSPLWNTLVVRKRKGTYRLNLPERQNSRGS